MTVTFILLLIVILMLWTPMVAISTSLHDSDAAGNAMASAYTASAAIGLWVALAVAMLMAGTRGGILTWAGICAFILAPASGAAALKAIDLLSGRGFDGKYVMAVPALAPPLIVAYALWAFFPQIRAIVPAGAIGATVWGGVLVLSMLPLPVVISNSRIEAEAQAKAAVEAPKIEAERQAAELAEWAPKLEKLDPQAPLHDWIQFTEHGEELRKRAFAGLRQVKSRQSNAEEMIGMGMGWPLIELVNLDLEPTPSLCEKARQMLNKNAKGITPPVPGRPYSWEKRSIDEYLSAMEWLLGNGCDCMAEVVASESAVRAYPRAADRDQTLATLGRLRRGS